MQQVDQQVGLLPRIIQGMVEVVISTSCRFRVAAVCAVPAATGHYLCVGVHIFSVVGKTSTLGPVASQAACRSSASEEGSVRVAEIPNDCASATKSGRVSSVPTACPKASRIYSRRMP